MSVDIIIVSIIISYKIVDKKFILQLHSLQNESAFIRKYNYSSEINIFLNNVLHKFFRTAVWNSYTRMNNTSSICISIAGTKRYTKQLVHRWDIGAIAFIVYRDSVTRITSCTGSGRTLFVKLDMRTKIKHTHTHTCRIHRRNYACWHAINSRANDTVRFAGAQPFPCEWHMCHAAVHVEHPRSRSAPHRRGITKCHILQARNSRERIHCC